jgi:hypothetical protein
MEAGLFFWHAGVRRGVPEREVGEELIPVWDL